MLRLKRLNAQAQTLNAQAQTLNAQAQTLNAQAWRRFSRNSIFFK